MTQRHPLTTTLFLSALLLLPAGAVAEKTLLNSSYDIARELFQDVNEAFLDHYQTERGEAVTIRQSHGGSSRQARSILEGMSADVVTFNQTTDVEALVDGGVVSEDWREHFPHNASPHYSLPAFLVRDGNPKGIEDWGDLAREDVSIVFPNPKTSGNGRYTYLAAWAWAERKYDGDEAQVRDFMRDLLANVRVFDTGGRGATTSFVERRLGDVLITFESEVHGIRGEYGEDAFEPVVPSLSVLAEFPVAVVERTVARRDSRELAEDYLEFLYSTPGQEILAQHHYRVRDENVAKAYADRFPEVELVRVEDVFGSWREAQAEHFASDATMDQLQSRRGRR